MSLFIAAVLAASPSLTATQTAPAAAPAAHAHKHGQKAEPGAKPHGEGCCCKGMAEGDKKMACCAEHADHGGEHAKHGATR